MPGAEATVTIRLTGGDYRTLCREIDAHLMTLIEYEKQHRAELGPKRREFLQRIDIFRDVVETVQG